MNNFTFEIFDFNTKTYTDYTAFAVFPFSFANLLDEQLDEAQITLKGLPKTYTHPITGVTVNNGEVFKPFTICRVGLANAPKCVLTEEQNNAIVENKNNSDWTYGYDSINKKRYEFNERLFFVANDRAVEKPVGSGRYNHDIYLIELTKITERYIGDNLTFTNSLGSNYNDKAYARCDFEYKSDLTSSGITTTEKGSFYSSVIKNFNNTEQTITFLTPEELETQESNLPNNVFFPDLVGADETKTLVGVKDTSTNANIQLNNYMATFEEGIYSVNYYYSAYLSSLSGVAFQTLNLKYTFVIVKNRLPLKKWTVTDVINRLFDLVEPIRYAGASVGQTYPRFRLDGVRYNADGTRQSTYIAGSIAEKLDKIIAPEFAFTVETLRESLQQVGGFIHGEPRITGFTYRGNGAPYFIINFDLYGGNEYSNISKEKPITSTLGVDVNQYCTALDSPTENLTNTLNWAQGVIVEPFDNGTRTVRTETTTARLAEDNTTFIPTLKGISLFGGIPNSLTVEYNGSKYDLTPYVFEKTDYDLLSSYDGYYPFSKAYALFYTQNEPNIYGLFFKVPSAINPIFREYAIVNILRAVTGDSSINLSGQEILTLEYTVSYKPIYSARIRTHKQCILDNLPSTLAYNQSANLIESTYYSENLRGAVERLGNVEKTYTYHLTFISQIPKVGTKFDKDYYITSVSCEFLPVYIKCTVALSKRFNRKSQYVGINTMKRMWEISERNAIKRESNYNTFIMISETASESDITLAQASAGILTQSAKNLLNANNLITSPVSAVMVTPKDINKDDINSNYQITLPVIASAFNTAMTFTFDFFDNYSAGQKLTTYSGQTGEDGTDTASGLWGEYVPYTDYYGRVYWLAYTLYGGNNLILVSGNANSLPQAEIGTLGYTALKDYVLYRKDNREIPQVTAQITVVTDNEDVIIGSALCRNCALVNRSPIAYKLYAFKNTISALDGKINNLAEMLTSGEALEVTQGVTINNSSIVLPSISNANQYKAWALVTDVTETVIDVSTEDGQTDTTQTITEGGEILIGKNNAQINGQTLYFTAKNSIY